MNIRFLAQSEYYNGIHLKDDVVLEKEYEDSPFANIKKVRYFIYRLEDNVRKEVLPHSEKIEAFDITDCGFRSDYIYFTEYDDQYDGTYVFNIIRYNFIDGTHTKIISLKDDMSLYPDQKQIKIYILDKSNLIIQRAMPRENYQGNYAGFFDFTSILFNFVDNRQYSIVDENLINNGIEYMIPFNENICIMKTGYSLYKENRHELLEKDEAAVETLLVVNIQQFISDLLLEHTNMVISAIDQAYYDTTLPNAKIEENHLIYVKYDFQSGDETVVFYNVSTKEALTCINKSSSALTKLSNAVVINGVPHIILDKNDSTQFIDLNTNETVATYEDENKVVFCNNDLIVSKYQKKSIFSGTKHYVAIHKFPSEDVILEENGKYIGAVAASVDTTYIFLQ